MTVRPPHTPIKVLKKCGLHLAPSLCECVYQVVGVDDSHDVFKLIHPIGAGEGGAIPIRVRWFVDLGVER